MKKRFLTLVSSIFIILICTAVGYAQEEQNDENGATIIPVNIELEEENNNENGAIVVPATIDINGEDVVDVDINGEDVVEIEPEEVIEIEPEEVIEIEPEEIEIPREIVIREEYEKMDFLKVGDMDFRKIAKVETMEDSDGNMISYYYNHNGEIIEKIIGLCPPKGIRDQLLEEYLLRHKEAYPLGDPMLQSQKMMREDIGIEIKTGFVVDEGDGFEADDIDAAVFYEESEDPIAVGESPILLEEIDIEESLQGDTSDYYILMDSTNLMPGGGRDVDTLNEKYTIYKPDRSYIESLLIREAYEAGRVTIVVSQGILVDWDNETYECDFSVNYDSYHYIDGVLLRKFEFRKGSYKSVEYDPYNGNIVSERIHKKRAGNTYDLFIHYSNEDVLRQEIYYGGEMAYSTIPENENINRFENVRLIYSVNGDRVKRMEEIILNNINEVINKDIVTVDFSIYDVPSRERILYSEIGVRKTYFDNWEMVKKVELCKFDGELVTVNYYGIDGLKIREERYEGTNLYSTIIFTFDNMGYVSRINYTDVLGNIYKYKEAGYFYSGYGEELTEEEFIKLQPDYYVGSQPDTFYIDMLKTMGVYDEKYDEYSLEYIEWFDREGIEELEEGMMEE